MVQDPKIRTSLRPTNRPEAIAAALQNKLESEAQLVDSLVANLSRGHPLPELWEQLHDAAVRAGRTPALAVPHPRPTPHTKVKIFARSVQFEILMHPPPFA